MKRETRKTYIDAAKGIGILLMILGHTMTPGVGKDMIYSFHMPLFFVCSGMTMGFSEDAKEWRHRAKRGAIRLLIPAVLLFAAMQCISGILNGEWAIEKDLLCLFFASGEDLVLHKGMVSSVGALWFLFVLFWAKFLLDGIFLLLKKYTWIPVLLLCMSAVMAAFPLPQALDLVPVAMLFLLMGKSLGERNETMEMQNAYTLASFGVWCLLFVVHHMMGETFDMAKRSYGIPLIGILMAYSGSVFFLSLCKRLGRISILEVCGRHSLLLLGIHYLGYLPYLYYSSLFSVNGVLCVLRLILELLVFGTILEIKGYVRGDERGQFGRRIGFLLSMLIQTAYLLFCRFPGGLQYDSINQITQVVEGKYSNHHPIFHTIWMTFSVEVAEHLGGDLTLGIFLFSFLQILVFSYMVSYVLGTLQKAGVREGWLFGVLLIFLLHPYHLFFAGYVNKDTLFACAGVIFVTAMFRMELEDAGKGDLWHLILAGLGVSLFRSNGLIAMCLLLGILLLFRKKQKDSGVLRCVLLVVFGALLIRFGVGQIEGIAGGYTSENFSIPLQQVARVVAEEKELQPREEELINDLCDVSGMTGGTFTEYIKENYNSWRADEIKGQIQFWGRDAYLREHLTSYGRLWIRLGLRYPETYVTAWYEMTSGYWLWRGTTDYAHEVYPTTLDLRQTILLQEVNEGINQYLMMWQKNPLLRVLIHPASAFWLTVFMFVLLWKKDPSLGQLCILPLAVVITLFVAVPLNGQPRYVYLLYGCILLFFPLLFQKGDC